MKKYIICTILLLLAAPTYAGEYEFRVTFPLGAGGKVYKPEVKLGRGDVQIRFDTITKYNVELGDDLEWNPRNPRELIHKDNYLDIDFDELYNFEEE